MSGSKYNALEIKRMGLCMWCAHRNEHFGQLWKTPWRGTVELRQSFPAHRGCQISACIYQATVWYAHLPLPPVSYRSTVQTLLFHVLTDYSTQLKRKIGGEAVVSGSFLFYSIATPWLDLKNHFQQAIPAPWVTMETLHLKIDLEEWKLWVEYASLMWFRKMYGSRCTKRTPPPKQKKKTS